MIIVTGGAGFIGSNVVAALNEAGRADVVVCDLLGDSAKWRNLAKRQLADIVPPAELMAWLVAMAGAQDTRARTAFYVPAVEMRCGIGAVTWPVAASAA